MSEFEQKNGGKHATENLLMTSSKDAYYVDSFDDDEDNDVTGNRHQWGKKLEYFLSAVGYCVGLGNIWRFPYVCMRNGGGAFLIPFMVSLLICALPLYFMESAIGQFNARSCYHVWNICPLFKGMGISMNILSFYFVWYHSTILAWSLIYLGYSFTSPLPWTKCGQEWNSIHCVTPQGVLKNDSEAESGVFNNGSSMVSALLSVEGNNTTNMFGNYTTALEVLNNKTKTVPSTEEFWTNKVLERTSGLHDMGGLALQTTLALIVANICITLAVIKGVKSTGKVVYITATLPYILLTIMLILGVTLPGSGDGMLFYIKPDFSKLLSTDTWIDAFIQVFYSLGPGWGPLITMSSYNKFNNNCMRDSIILSLCCEGTSVFGGFAIFSILGHMAYIQGVDISTFANSGAGLAFIVYPTAISYLPVPQLWGVLFFTMLFSLGLDTQFASIETIMTSIQDAGFRFTSVWRKTSTCIVMGVITLLSLVFASRAGIYMFTLIDWYVAAFSMMTQVILECVVVAWIYGTDKFCRDIELMLGRKPYYIFTIFWKFLTPAMLVVVFGTTLVTFEPAYYGSYVHPSGAQTFGWILSIIPFLSIVIYAIYELTNHRGSLWTRVKSACRPSPEWCPALPEVREKYSHELPPHDVQQRI